MNEAYNYDVIICGLDGIPLRTTAKGAKALMQSFHSEPNMENLLLEVVDGGTPFKNSILSVTAVFPRPKIKLAVESVKSRTLSQKLKPAEKAKPVAVKEKKLVKKTSKKR